MQYLILRSEKHNPTHCASLQVFQDFSSSGLMFQVSSKPWMFSWLWRRQGVACVSGCTPMHFGEKEQNIEAISLKTLYQRIRLELLKWHVTKLWIFIFPGKESDTFNGIFQPNELKVVEVDFDLILFAWIRWNGLPLNIVRSSTLSSCLEPLA